MDGIGIGKECDVNRVILDTLGIVTQDLETSKFSHQRNSKFSFIHLVGKYHDTVPQIKKEILSHPE